MGTAELTIFLCFKTLRMILFLLGHIVVTLLALRTCQCNLNAHNFHLQCFHLRESFFYFLHKKKTQLPCRPSSLSHLIHEVKCFAFFIEVFLIKIKMSTLNSTFFHIFIVLPFCTIRSLFYCIFSLLGSAIVRLPLLPASHAPYFRSYASCFTSSSNSSPAE